jgi:predicted phage tail protein
MTEDIRGAGGGGGGGGKGGKKRGGGESRTPVEAANNLFSVAFAKTVVAVSEGEIEGFPNEPEQDIYLDGTAIKRADGTYNFQGFELDYRSGEDETQDPMPGFLAAENTVGVGVQVSQVTGPITRTITDSDTERVRVIIQHPSLQAIDINTGDTNPTSVSYRISLSTNGGPFVTQAEPTVSGKSSGQFQRAYEFDLPGAGPWQVRVTRLTADSTTTYLANEIIWQAYTEIIDENFAYPNTAVVGVKVDARQFDSIPAISMRVRGKRVQVPTNYDPAARTYTGLWDGTFKTVWTDNPAWIFRDIVINERYGVARYVPGITADKWYLYTVSQYCDEMVPDGLGGTEPRFTCNVYLQNAGSVYEVLNAMASIFRGMVYYSQGKLYATQDREQIPVQQFTEANVIQEVDESGTVTSPCFTYVGSSKTARKSVVMANWDDPAQQYNSVVEYLQDDALLTKFGYNPIDLRLVGVTSRGQALRAAKHTLFSNRYETDTVNFRVGAEGLATSVGELIQIADPLKEGRRLGGRVTAINTTDNTVTLDAVLSLNPSYSYTLTLVIPNGETVINPDGTTTTTPKLQRLTVVSYTNTGNASDLNDLLAQDYAVLVTQSDDVLEGFVSLDEATTTLLVNSTILTQIGTVWVLEWSELTPALYRVIGISEPEPLIYEIQAVQSNQSKFGYVDNDLPIAIPKDRFVIRDCNPPTDVTVGLVYKNGRVQINAQWVAPSYDSIDDLQINRYKYQYKLTGSEQWSDAIETVYTNITVPLDEFIFGNSYEFRVASRNRLGQQSDWNEVPVTAFSDISNLADPIYGASITHANQPDGTQLLLVSAGNCPIPERVNGFRIWAKQRTEGLLIPGVKEPNADGWYYLSDIPLTGYYAIGFHAPDTYDVRVAFTSAIFGEVAADYLYDTVERGEIVPPTPINFTVVQSNLGSKRFSWQIPLSSYGTWDKNIVSDIISYEIRYKQGALVNSSIDETWEQGIPLYSGGVPATQQWFETFLFDTDQWVVMVKAVDATKWVSDSPSVIQVNVTGVAVQNAVYENCISTSTWPGTLINAERVGSIVRQIDPTQPSYYTWNFDNNFYESSIVITTTADATYQHYIGALSGADTLTFQENGNEIFQENNNSIFLEQRTYDAGYLSGANSGVLHPYAPYERLQEDVYQVQTLFTSPDGVTKGEISGICFELDYVDVFESFNNVTIPATSGGLAISLTKPFREIKSVQVTLQDAVGTTATSALLVSKSTGSITVRCINSAGNPAVGNIDVTVVGY